MANKQVFSVTAWGHPWTPVVFGCIRVSQAEGESGLATQRRTLNEHRLRDDRIYTDVTSGKSMLRPAWQQLRGILRPGDVVVVPRIDRPARNLSEGLRAVQELHEQGIHIRALAEWERDSIEMRDQRKIRNAATPQRRGRGLTGRLQSLSTQWNTLTTRHSHESGNPQFQPGSPAVSKRDGANRTTLQFS